MLAEEREREQREESKKYWPKKSEREQLLTNSKNKYQNENIFRGMYAVAVVVVAVDFT